MMNHLEILEHFSYEGEIINIERYGEGHINETYLVKTTLKRYILQGINEHLFQDIPALMENITLVSSFIKDSLKKEGKDYERLSLTCILTKDDKPFYNHHGKYYRLYVFIENSKCYQRAETPFIFYQSARAFGEFVKRLGDFDASKLKEIIPDFHNTDKRYQDFLKAVEEDCFQRRKEVEKEIAFIKQRKAYCSRIVTLLKEGKMPLRVTHNDTKLNNVLFDADDNHALAVIDLDTIMPGSVCYDFGDSIRFGCSTSYEDEQDLTKVHFDLDLFRIYAKGYLETAGDTLKEIEINHLAFGAILMTYECGMRFLEDYLKGDCYFKIKREKQNLDRARTQLKLVYEMEERLDEMNKIILDCYHNL